MYNILHIAVYINSPMVFAVLCIYTKLIISPNEVFGDIMVLASPPRPRPRPPRPPVDPDDVNTLTRQILHLSLSNFI